MLVFNLSSLRNKNFGKANIEVSNLECITATAVVAVIHVCILPAPMMTDIKLKCIEDIFGLKNLKDAT